MSPPEILGGRFQVEREVGRGAVGVVYRAYDTETRVDVALKVIASRGAEGEAARFTREGRVLSTLDHPHIVKVVAYGALDDGTPFLAMEWLDGEDLAARQRREPLSLRGAVEVARQVALALAAAHEAGIVHRDVKPTNVFLLRDAGGDLRVKLVDFGVAAAGDVRLTISGGFVGTPAYMAPEQARGDAPVDGRADLFALGATLFELLTGRPPHVGPTPIATLARLVTTEAPRASDLSPEVPGALDELIASLLATRPEGRPSSAREVAYLLDACLDDVPSATLGARSSEPVPSTALGSGSRLVTSIVALSLTGEEARSRAFELARSRGADSAPLGQGGMVAHLGARQATGDEAARAVDLALALARDGAKVGVATGRTRVQNARPVGEVVDRASALARDAEPGQVLADATTAELTRGRYELSQRGGGSALVRGAVAARRGEGGGAPFVGREAELAQILGAYERCSDDDNPLVVSCVGAPGIGKSRLRREVLARIAATPRAPRLVVVRCESFGQGYALGLAAELLRALVGLSKGATAVAAATAIDLRLGGTVRSAEDRARDLLARLVADEAFDDGARDALWPAMTDVLLKLVAEGALALVVEDAQWADPESVAWVDHLLGRAQGRPLFVLMLARPSLFKDSPRLFAGRDHVRIDLRPVSRRATRAIARAVLGERATDETVERISAQAAGSPLFAEELARLSAIGRDAAKAPTIEAAIQASLDALDPPLRDAALRLSTFGLSGWEGGLVALGVPDAGEVLRLLAAHEIVVEQADSRFAGHREHAFKHALVREVAYSSLDADGKKMLHGIAARWLEGMNEDSATVARHFELGGASEQAGAHWERAARRALAADALGDAVAMGERALAFAVDGESSFARALVLDEAYARLDARSPERETSVRALAESAYDEASRVRAEGAHARYDDSRGAGAQIFERLADVRRRAAELDLVDEEARSGAALAARYAFAGSLVDAEREASSLLALGEKKGVTQAAIDGWQTLAIVRQTRGELLAALDARRNAARAAAQAGLRVREATLTINVGFALTTIGAQKEARAAIEQGLAIASNTGSQGVLGLGRMLLLGWAATFGADAAVDRVLIEPRAQADQAAQGGWTPNDRVTLGVLFYRGVELLRRGDPDAPARARTLLKMAAEAYRATGMRDVLPVALGEWAEAERRAGDPARAVELAREAAELLEAGAPSLLNEAPVYLALHDAAGEVGDAAAARDAIARAMPPLVRRLTGLGGSPYALGFLTRLPHNAALIATSENYGLLPREVESLLERAAS